MTREEVFARLKEVFQDVFDKEVALSDATTAADVPGWDSLMHIALISEVEETFGIKFTMNQILSFQNVGELAEAVLAAVA